ncbi:hypothetical protein MMPV_001594 [Pyropia vietnamensis]
MVDRSRIRLVRSPAGGEELRLPLGELGALLDASFVMAAALRVEPDADSRLRCRGGNNPHHGRGVSSVGGGGDGDNGGEDRRYRDGEELRHVDDQVGDVEVASWRARTGESWGSGGGCTGGGTGAGTSYRRRQPSRAGGWSADGHRSRADVLDAGRHGTSCRGPPLTVAAMAVTAADVAAAADSQWGDGDEVAAGRRRGRGGGRPGGVRDPESAGGVVVPRGRSRPSASPRRRTLRIEIWEEGGDTGATTAATAGGDGADAASTGGVGVGTSPVRASRGAVIHKTLPPAYRDQWTDGGGSGSSDSAGNVGAPGRPPRGTVLHEIPPPATRSRCTDGCCGGSGSGSGSGRGSGGCDMSDVTPPRRRTGAGSESAHVAVPLQEDHHATLALWHAHHTAQRPALPLPPRAGTAPVGCNGVCPCVSRQPAKDAPLVPRGGAGSHHDRGSGRGPVIVGGVAGGGGGGGGSTTGDGWRVTSSPIPSDETGGSWPPLPPSEGAAATAVAAATAAHGSGHWSPAIAQQRGEVWEGRGIFQVRPCHDAAGARSGGGTRNGGDGGSSRGRDVSRGGGQSVRDGDGDGDSRRHLVHDLTSLDASPVASSPEASLDLPTDARSVAQMARAAAMALGEDGGGSSGAHQVSLSRQDGGREWADGRFVSGFRSMSTPLMVGSPSAGAVTSIPPTDNPTSRPTDSRGLPSVPSSPPASVRRASHDSGVPSAAASVVAAVVGRTPTILPLDWGGRGAALPWSPPPPPPPAKRSAWFRAISRRLLARGRRVVGSGGGGGDGDGGGGRGGRGLKKVGGGGGDGGGSSDGTVGLSLVVRLSVAVAAVEAAAAAVDGGFSVTSTSTSADAHTMRCTKRVAVAGASHMMVATIRVARLGGTSPPATTATAAEGATTAPDGGQSGRRQSSPPGRAAAGRSPPADPGATVTVRRPREDRRRTDFWRYARLAREVAAWLDATVPGCVMEAPVMT